MDNFELDFTQERRARKLVEAGNYQLVLCDIESGTKPNYERTADVPAHFFTFQTDVLDLEFGDETVKERIFVKTTFGIEQKTKWWYNMFSALCGGEIDTTLKSKDFIGKNVRGDLFVGNNKDGVPTYNNLDVKSIKPVSPKKKLIEVEGYEEYKAEEAERIANFANKGTDFNFGNNVKDDI